MALLPVRERSESLFAVLVTPPLCLPEGSVGAAFGLATTIAAGFARERWCVNITGESGGGALALPTSVSEGGLSCDLQRAAADLTRCGITVLRPGAAPNTAVFDDVSTLFVPRYYGEGDAVNVAATNTRARTKLPFRLLSSRIAHDRRVGFAIHRRQWEQEAAALGEPVVQVLQRWANRWVLRLVQDADSDPERKQYAAHPLRVTRLELRQVDGCYRYTLEVTPNFPVVTARRRLHGGPV